MPFGLATSWPELKKEMDLYRQAPGTEEPLVCFYEDLFKIWYDCREQIKESYFWQAEEINDSLRQGRFLLYQRRFTVDAALYRTVLERIVHALSSRFPETGGLKKLLKQPGLQGSGLDIFLMNSTLLNSEKMINYVAEQKWDEAAGVEAELAAYILFQALAPFYQTLGAAVASLTDFSLWRQGFCPLCGQKPGMAKLRQEDGARILECWLCHVQWQFPRLECPFCANKNFEQLQFFYADDFPGRRVQLCGCCKSYLKTVVLKEIGREVILELDNIFSLQLDLLARREGYLPGENLHLLS